MKSGSKMQHTLAGAALLVLACAAMFAASTGQLGNKMIYMNQIENVWDAVRVTGVYIAGQKVETGNYNFHGESEPGVAVQADNNWIKNTTIAFTNRTDETISCATFHLWFPDTKGANSPNSMTMYTLRIGRRPASALFLANGSKIPPDTGSPFLLAPGQSTIVSLAADSEAIQTAIEGLGKTPLSNVSRMVISPQEFYFPDGMMWWLGHYYVPNDSHPAKYTRLADTYFPGNVARTRSLQ